MNVSLPPELEKFIDGKVKSGFYNNASEVVRAGLRLLKERDDLPIRWREQMERGATDGDAGPVVGGPNAMVRARRPLKNTSKKRA